jgi:hypothetical protein
MIEKGGRVNPCLMRILVPPAFQFDEPDPSIQLSPKYFCQPAQLP